MILDKEFIANMIQTRYNLSASRGVTVREFYFNSTDLAGSSNFPVEFTADGAGQFGAGGRFVYYGRLQVRRSVDMSGLAGAYAGTLLVYEQGNEIFVEPSFNPGQIIPVYTGPIIADPPNIITAVGIDSTLSPDLLHSWVGYSYQDNQGVFECTMEDIVFDFLENNSPLAGTNYVIQFIGFKIQIS